MKPVAHGIPYGMAPWHQTSWDARAAGNFIGGGIGAGLLAVASVSAATGQALAVLWLLGLAFVGAGLASVALELGRPLRAVNVFRNPRTSWMSREAIVGTLLAAVVLTTFAGQHEWRALVALLALAFLFCQARLLHAAKGIPAWHARGVVPLVVITGLAEGAGAFWLTAGLHGAATKALLLAFAALLVARVVLWQRYRAHLAETSPAAHAALGATGRLLLWGGTIVPLVLLAAAIVASAPAATWLAGLAGLLGLVAGSHAKFTIVTRAAFNRGFVLPELPVRGARA